MQAKANKPKRFFSNLPSIVWVIIIPIALVVGIGAIIATFFAISSIEGVASVIMLLAGFAAVRASNNPKLAGIGKPEKAAGWATAMGIVFFSLMGVAIDQTGNFLYNKPLEIFYCPANTVIARTAEVSHPLPGRTDITQNFYCVDQRGELLGEVGIFSVVFVRFIEYVLLGYGLIGFNSMLSKLSRRRRAEPQLAKSPAVQTTA